MGEAVKGPQHLPTETPNGMTAVENGVAILKNKTWNTEVPSDPAISLRGIHPKELQAGSQADICAPIFRAALFTAVKKLEPTQAPIHG